MTLGTKKESFELQLDLRSGVPVYRQIIDQIALGMATGVLKGGDQLPTVRRLAVDLAINPNTVIRAYREMEIKGLIETQQGTGTFIAHKKIKHDEVERERQLNQLVGDFAARAGSAGFTIRDLIQRLQEMK